MNKLELRQIILRAATLLAIASSAALCNAQGDPDSKKPKSEPSSSPGQKVASPPQAPAPAGATTPKRLLYRPPQRGAPAVRVNAGSRGAAESLPALYVLAPNHAGLTTQSQPTLHWYLSGPTAHVEISLFLENDPKPLLELKLKGVTQAGIQKLSLSQQGVTLRPNLEYQWVVALVPDANNRSKDLVASAVVKRIAPTPALKEKTASAKAPELPMIFADNGIWFDAFDALLNWMAAKPKDAEAVDQITALLEQVGLQEVKIKP